MPLQLLAGLADVTACRLDDTCFRGVSSQESGPGGAYSAPGRVALLATGKRDSDRCVKQDLRGIRNASEIIPLDLALQRWRSYRIW